MAALNRPKNATYEVHENVTVDTQDNEDHTFCGIMFPVKCKDLLPVDHLVIKSVAVRGHLGPLTVWVSNANGNQDRSRQRRSSSSRNFRRRYDEDQEAMVDGEYRIPLHPSAWTKVYEKTHKPCPRGQYTELVFDEPVCLHPGEMRAIYVHSTLLGDQAIVYDNSYYGSSSKRYDDDKLSILTGRAHVSTTCFGQDPIWGWGNAWRDRREFVGRLAYGTVYKLWNPEVSPKFGNRFHDATKTLFLCQRRWESPISALPDEAVYYILNMCRWDWFDDGTKTMKDRRKREKTMNKLLIAQQQLDQDNAVASKAVPSTKEDDDEDAKPSANIVTSTKCGRNPSVATVATAQKGKTTGLGDSDEDNDEGDDESSGKMSSHDSATEEDDHLVDKDMDTDSDDDGSSISEDSSEDDDIYHTANRRHFSFNYPDSDSDDEKEDSEQSGSPSPRNQWIRRQIARVHVLRALAAMDDQAFNQSL
mmetsp:Transcript_17574/g.40333  ORF Transcript_17574/g.40333 Transcript_17574/m.40333 type:complete len:475 (+) Transcript_17574:140-1564(+)